MGNINVRRSLAAEKSSVTVPFSATGALLVILAAIFAIAPSAQKLVQ